MLGGSRFSSSENAASDGRFEPSSAFSVAAAKDASRMHDKDAVRCLAVDVSAVFLPFARFLLFDKQITWQESILCQCELVYAKHAHAKFLMEDNDQVFRQAYYKLVNMLILANT